MTKHQKSIALKVVLPFKLSREQGATDAAGRMTKDLKKIYNRARQESITKELLDIVGGASAVS